MAHGGPSKRKLNNGIVDNNEEDELPKPPDGGWGWVIVIASFLIHIITDGITYTFGVIYVELLNEFNEGKGYTSWILSLMSGMTLMSGPISSSFVNKYGCRVVTIAGAILASLCLLVSYYAQNVFTLIITIGFGVGCGLGLIYLPAIVSVSTYFEKYRSIAIGIAVAGSGCGTFIFSPFIAFLIQELQWRKTLIVLSGIILNCALFGSLFRPLPAPTETDTNRRRSQNYESVTQNGNHKVRNPTVSAISNGMNGVNSHMPRSQSVGHSMATKKHPNGKAAQPNGQSYDTRYALSQPLLINSEFETKPLNEGQRRASRTLSRKDIFYQGSLHNISNYNELSTDTDKYGSFQRVNADEDFMSSKNCFECISSDDSDENVFSMINFALLKDPLFILFVLSNFCTCLGFFVPYFCLADKAKMVGLPSEEASYLLSIIGIANTIGRIVLGYISDKSWVNRLWVYNVCICTSGISTAVSAFVEDFYSLAIYAAVYGFTIGAYVGLTSVILVDLLGIDKLTSAFGLLLLFQGIAGFIGPPIVGFLFDKTHTYLPGFLFAGTMIALSGFMFFFIPSLQKFLVKKQMRAENEQLENGR